MGDGPNNTPEAEAGPEQEKTRESLSHSVQHMSVREKIKLAMTGNREARTLLLKDINKLVQEAVLNNPRITENEIVSLATSRSVDDELLRKISDNRNWMKNYQVRLALVNNPKTPLPVAMKLVNGLLVADLKKLAKSKGVSNVVASVAQRTLLRKRPQ
jgi:hypothetical protein